MMVRKILILLFVCILVLAVTAKAETPDGVTPAEETVCDNETGGAYVLCNAYCEAMDCDSENPNADEMACVRVRDNYFKVTGFDLPCEEDDCFDANEHIGVGYYGQKVRKNIEGFIVDCIINAGCGEAEICETVIGSVSSCTNCVFNTDVESCNYCNEDLTNYGCSSVCY